MKKELVNIKLPINASHEVKELLFSYSTYSNDIPKLKKLKKVFVTYDGLVLKNGLLAGGCAFNLRGKADNTFYYFFWRDVIEKYAVCRWGKSLVSHHLKGPQKYLLIHSKWFNYSFWINSFLPRLVQAENAGILNDVKLIVPEGWKNIPYVWDSLEAFNISKEIIPADSHLFVDHLIMPETRKWTYSFNPQVIQNTSSKLIDYALKTTDAIRSNTKKIYLTRSQRGVRCAENEEAVLALVVKFGYTPISFEDFSIWQQVLIMQQATHFISIHGAGMSNLMFMPPNSAVLELINRPYAHAEYTFPFWTLANSVQVRYFMQLCDVVNGKDAKLSFGKKRAEEDVKYLVNENLIVDLCLLESNLQLMEQNEH